MRLRRMSADWLEQVGRHLLALGRPRLQHDLDAAAQVQAQPEVARDHEHGGAGQQHGHDPEDEQITSFVRHEPSKDSQQGSDSRNAANLPAMIALARGSRECDHGVQVVQRQQPQPDDFLLRDQVPDVGPREGRAGRARAALDQRRLVAREPGVAQVDPPAAASARRRCGRAAWAARSRTCRRRGRSSRPRPSGSPMPMK